MKVIKTSVIFIAFLFALLAVSTNSKKVNKKNHKGKTHLKSKEAPRGETLRNHFGTPNIASPYGPQDDQIANYVAANPDTFAPMLGAKNRAMLIHKNDFHPYPGYEEKLNPSPVKAGEYTNIAPSATHEVYPEITGPKLHVAGSYEYPVAAKVPTFYGYQKEFHPVIAYDRATGEIIEDSVLIKRPIYNYENRAVNINKKFDQFYDLRNGQRLSVLPKLKKHGINQVKDD